MATVFTDLQTRFNTWLRDTQNLTFTSAEKTELLTEAINDPYVYQIVRDSSLTTLANTYTYTIPTGITSMTEFGININGNGIFQALPRNTYDLINGTIYLNTISLPVGKTLFVIGKKKLDITASDYPEPLPEYILHLAMVGAFEMLKTSLTTRFVKNDMTMSEIINSINTHKLRAQELRRELANQRLVTI